MKKQIMSIVLAVSMLASLFTAFMLPAVAADDPTERAIYVTDNAIVVDGKLDEDYLESDKIVSIYRIRDKDPNLNFEGYAVATKAGIYIWLEIKGDTTYVNEAGRNVNDYKSQKENRDYLQVYYNMSANGNSDHIGYVMHDYHNSTYFRNEAGSNQTGTCLVALYATRFNDQVLNDTSSANGAEESLLGLRCVVNENVADGVGTAIKMTHVRCVIGADGCVGNVVQIKVAGEDGIGGVLSIVDLCGKSL